MPKEKNNQRTAVDTHLFCQGTSYCCSVEYKKVDYSCRSSFLEENGAEYSTPCITPKTVKIKKE